MTPATALALLVALGYVRHCPRCDRWLPVTAFARCTPSVDANGEPYRYEHRRGECESCRQRRLRVDVTPMEAMLGITIAIRPARDYNRRIAA